MEKDFRDLRGDEPKISDVEKMVLTFRAIHGDTLLLEFIREITNNPKVMTEKPVENKDKVHAEPKLSELEDMVNTFRDTHGHEKLMDSLLSIIRYKGDELNKIQKTKPQRTEKREKDHFIYPLKQSQENNNFLNRLKHYGRILRETMKHRKYRYPTVAIGFFVGIYLLFSLPVIITRFSWKKPVETNKTVVKTEQTVQKKMADSATLDPGEVIPADNRIVIPKINVSAPIVYIESKDEKNIDEGLRQGVVHYSGTAVPGDIGNSFITGHSSNYWWDKGKFNYVFVLLDKLEAGDKVIVYQGGKKFVFTVRDKVVVAPEDMSVLNQTDTPVLSLMTCTPPGTSWRRLVVRLDRTDPAFYKPEKVIKQTVVETPISKPKKSMIKEFFSLFIPN